MHFDKVKKHCDGHKDNDFISKQLDRKSINCSFVLNQLMQVTPSQTVGSELMHLLSAVSEYSMKHKENPITKGVLKRNRRSIKDSITEMGEEGLNAIIIAVKKILDRYETFTIDYFIIVTWEIDHKRLRAQRCSVGCITMDLKLVNKNEISKCYSFPVKTFQITDKEGKNAQENFKNFREYLQNNWMPENDRLRYIKHMSVMGDAAVMTNEFKQLLANDPDLKHFDKTNGPCLHHGAGRMNNQTIREVYHDCDLKFPNLAERKEGQKRDQFWWDSTYKKDFTQSLNHFSTMLSKQNVEGDGLLTFGSQSNILQKYAIKKKMMKEKAGEDWTNNLSSDHIVNGAKQQFFGPTAVQTKKPKIWSVKDGCNDKKMRKTIEKFEAGLYSIHYMLQISRKEDFKSAFFETSKQCSTRFIYDTSRFLGLQKYIFSLTDTSDGNCSILRIVNIALKVTLDDDLDNIWTQ